MCSTIFFICTEFSFVFDMKVFNSIGQSKKISSTVINV